MRKHILPWVPGVLSITGLLAAQSPPERARVLCDKADPKNRCIPPGPECVCLPDTLEIVLEGQDDSVLLVDFAKGQPITATVFLDVKSPDTPDADVQGWSYGVLHDATVLSILSATYDGTDVEGLIDRRFIFGDPGPAIDVVTCETNHASCPNPQPGGGFISAIVLSLRKPVELPPGKRSSIARARYETTGRGVRDTLLQFTDRLATKGSPPVSINITVAGNAGLPEKVIDGLIINQPGTARFRRGDADGNQKLNFLDALILIQVRAGIAPGRITCDDAEDANDDGLLSLSDGIYVLNYLFTGGPPPPAPQCGPDETGDALGCRRGEC